MQPDGVNLWYSKRRLVDLTEIIVLNVKGLRHWVAKIYFIVKLWFYLTILFSVFVRTWLELFYFRETSRGKELKEINMAWVNWASTELKRRRMWWYDLMFWREKLYKSTEYSAIFSLWNFRKSSYNVVIFRYIYNLNNHQ